MTRSVLLRPRAETDLAEIWNHTVSLWSLAQAEIYLSDLGSALRRLAEFPEIARLRSEFDPPVRLHRYASLLIVYRSTEAEIDVIRILHGWSNWAVLLTEQDRRAHLGDQSRPGLADRDGCHSRGWHPGCTAEDDERLTARLLDQCRCVGHPLRKLQKWLGHARLSTTTISADAVGWEEYDIASKMSSLGIVDR